jgi:hypothetical protein
MFLFSTGTSGTDILASGRSLHIDERMTSANGRFFAIMQSDGNFAAYKNPGGLYTDVWNSNTQNSTGIKITMHTNGNLFLYNKDSVSLWSAITNHSGAYAKM